MGGLFAVFVDKYRMCASNNCAVSPKMIFGAAQDGIGEVPGEFPAQRQVARKKFPFDDVIVAPPGTHVQLD